MNCFGNWTERWNCIRRGRNLTTTIKRYDDPHLRRSIICHSTRSTMTIKRLSISTLLWIIAIFSSINGAIKANNSTIGLPLIAIFILSIRSIRSIRSLRINTIEPQSAPKNSVNHRILRLLGSWLSRFNASLRFQSGRDSPRRRSLIWIRR